MFEKIGNYIVEHYCFFWHSTFTESKVYTAVGIFFAFITLGLMIFQTLCSMMMHGKDIEKNSKPLTNKQASKILIPYYFWTISLDIALNLLIIFIALQASVIGYFVVLVIYFIAKCVGAGANDGGEGDVSAFGITRSFAKYYTKIAERDNTLSYYKRSYDNALQLSRQRWSIMKQQ